MSTALVLANKRLLINIDYNLQLKDLYFPHIGQENQLNRYLNRMFLFFDNAIHEVNNNEWEIRVDYLKDIMIGSSSIRHRATGIQVEFEDYVDPDTNIYIREFKVTNPGSDTKDILLFFQNNFALAESTFADTVVWYQPAGCLLQYKKNRYIGCRTDDKFYQFTCAAKTDNNGLGAYPGSDGSLGFNPVSTGNVNSCVSFKFTLNANSSVKSNIYYLCATDLDEVQNLVKYLKKNSLEVIRNRIVTQNTQLLNNLNAKIDLDKLKRIANIEQSEKLATMYKRSQLLMRTQIDNSGAVVAANDGQYLKTSGTDSYSYFWPRDGANVVLSMISSGSQTESEAYFRYAFTLMESKGYFLHKYFPDTEGKIKFLGSSWHPWVDLSGNAQLPIQEDATALNLYAFGCYLERFSSYQQLNKYWPKIKNSIRFLMDYTFRHYAAGSNLNKYFTGFEFNERDPFEVFKGSYLPLPSYDIWEQYYGVFTNTAVTVYAALQKAITILEIKGDQKLLEKVINFLPKLKKDIELNLFDKSNGRYIKGFRSDAKTFELLSDSSADASLFSLSQFKYLESNNPLLENIITDLVKRLTVNTLIGGLARKEDDHYLRLNDDYIGNPWFLPVFWKAQTEIRSDKLTQALDTLNWAVIHADLTGLMSEQVDPYSGYSLSVKPLTWNHAEFIQTVNLLLEHI
jgi:GH15 family glucan-1,4-alpha-glucosidase